MFLFKKRKTGLALGGGAARGIAHLGVLKVLEKYNFKPDIVVGTSMGAIIGAIYACKKYSSIDELIEILYDVLQSEEFESLGFDIFEENDSEDNNKVLGKFRYIIKRIILFEKMFKAKNHIIDGKKFEDVLKLFLPNVDIEDLPIKFATVALDIKTGEEVIINSGSLIKAVMASSSIPGIFPLVKYKNYCLVDGGWVDKVPAPAARRLGANKVVSVDVSITSKRESIDFKNSLEFMLYVDSITNDILKDLQSLSSDIVIYPKFAKDDWYDFAKFHRFIEFGEKAALEKISDMKKIGVI